MSDPSTLPRADAESIGPQESSAKGSQPDVTPQNDTHETDMGFSYAEEAGNGLRKRRRSSGGDKSEKAAALPLSHQLMANRRQLSQTHSEPDVDYMGLSVAPRAVTVERSVTWAEPRITVIPPTSSSGRSMLLSMHSEYTSITDELECVCGLLSPPRTPSLLTPPRPREASPQRRTRHTSEMSNPEMALFLEKEHLRDAEESDYKLMQDLIDKRFYLENDRDERFENNAFFLTVTDEVTDYRRSLRRSSAIEMKDLPTPCTDDPPFNFPEGIQRVNSSSSADTSCHNGGRGNARSEDPNYVVMCDSDAGDPQTSKEADLPSPQRFLSVRSGADADSSSEVFDADDAPASRRSQESPEAPTAVRASERKRLCRQESRSHEAIPRRSCSGRKSSLSESEAHATPRRSSKGSEHSDSTSESHSFVRDQGTRPAAATRKLSRQESQGKVGRQNLLECNLAGAQGSKKISSQPTLPPQEEEEPSPSDSAQQRGSQDSLMMPSETMC